MDGYKRLHKKRISLSLFIGNDALKGVLADPVKLFCLLRVDVNRDVDTDAGRGVSEGECAAKRAHPANDVFDTHVVIAFVNGLLQVKSIAIVLIVENKFLILGYQADIYSAGIGVLDGVVDEFGGDAVKNQLKCRADISFKGAERGVDFE